MNKYGPLCDYLKICGKQTIRLSFEEIEKIINDELPSSAQKFPQWWENQRKGTRQSDSWISAGYIVSNKNQQEQWVEFTKE